MDSIKAVCIIDGKCKGTIEFEEYTANKKNNIRHTKIKIHIKNLQKNSTHAIHIHESGDTRRGCSSLGSHYNPFNKTHGGHDDKIRQKDEYYKVATNFQRLCVGYGTNPGSGEIRNSRLFRILFNPTFEDDIYQMHNIFKKLIILRNLLYGINENFCLNEPEQGVFSCSRIHQFPKGGGFLQLHKDKDGEIVSRKNNLKTFLHPLLIFDEKGKDFTTGGGIIKYNEKIIFYEDN